MSDIIVYQRLTYTGQPGKITNIIVTRNGEKFTAVVTVTPSLETGGIQGSVPAMPGKRPRGTRGGGRQIKKNWKYWTHEEYQGLRRMAESQVKNHSQWPKGLRARLSNVGQNTLTYTSF